MKKTDLDYVNEGRKLRGLEPIKKLPSFLRRGAPLKQGEAHPNLLRGRNRHFGAKLADPGKAFNDAVEATVAERLAKSTG